MKPWRKGWISAFSYAIQGIAFTLRTQRNMRIHFLCGAIVSFFCIILDLTTMQISVLFLAVVGVIAMEFINTALEQIVDMAQPEFHPLAKAAKDTAAAAVLAMAVFALCIGSLILGPELIKYWKVTSRMDSMIKVYRLAVCIFLISSFVLGLGYALCSSLHEKMNPRLWKSKEESKHEQNRDGSPD